MHHRAGDIARKSKQDYTFQSTAKLPQQDYYLDICKEETLTAQSTFIVSDFNATCITGQEIPFTKPTRLYLTKVQLKYLKKTTIFDVYKGDTEFRTIDGGVEGHNHRERGHNRVDEEV